MCSLCVDWPKRVQKTAPGPGPLFCDLGSHARVASLVSPDAGDVTWISTCSHAWLGTSMYLSTSAKSIDGHVWLFFSDSTSIPGRKSLPTIQYSLQSAFWFWRTWQQDFRQDSSNQLTPWDVPRLDIDWLVKRTCHLNTNGTSSIYIISPIKSSKLPPKSMKVHFWWLNPFNDCPLAVHVPYIATNCWPGADSRFQVLPPASWLIGIDPPM